MPKPALLLLAAGLLAGVRGGGTNLWANPALLARG
jgi:hypothetical protein